MAGTETKNWAVIPGIKIREAEIRTVVVGTGAAGYHAAERLYQYGEKDMVILSEDVNAGTSRNAGSDKQTYYKLSLAGKEQDSVRSMAEDLFKGQCVDGDLALCEAALSAKCFYHLIELGVPFPDNEYGELIGYKTDHDRGRRASSAGPYTSKIMTECLERAAVSHNIRIWDKLQMVKLLVKEGKVYGVLCLDQNKTGRECCEFLLIWCSNVVLAAGGPAVMFQDSVYPASQRGASGIAFEAGVAGKNLTEWQFGMASLRPGWNVSGTYMQAIPRFVSTDLQGEDEKEFLAEYFEDPVQMQFLIFLKGYQWPFDTDKIWGGSSLIDLLVYQETTWKGRRVFLDFRRNPGGKEIEFHRLPREAYEYLSSAGACRGTPVSRLAHMNEPAIQFFREHGVDLHHEMLEIAVCAQHNNGGLSTDCNWQTNVEGIYAVGEICGSHGVTRPGGSALNAGQAGALRAAEHIAYVRVRNREAGNGLEGRRESFRQEVKKYLELLRISPEPSRLEETWKSAALCMSRYGGMVRGEEGIMQGLEIVDKIRKGIGGTVCISDYSQAGMLFHLYDMVVSQKVYLTAMLDYIRRGGGSRGSALYSCPDGKKPLAQMPQLYRCRPDGGKLGNEIQEIQLCGGECRTSWRCVRPLPEPDTFFETQWKAFRERRP